MDPVYIPVNFISNMDEFRNAENITDSVNEYCTYICEARDSYGNDNNIWFYVSVDNKLKVRGSDNVAVSYGGEAELEVQAICRNGKLKYTWWIDGELDPGATGATYTLFNVTKYHYVRCQVQDQYGNEGGVYFYIKVENHLEAYFSATVNGTTREIETEYDMYYGEEINTITIQPGDELTITYNVSRDQGILEYSWSDWQDGKNQAADIEGNEYTSNGSINRSISCSVKDQYDNSVSESINVRIDNGFNAEPAVPTYQEVNEGANVTLKVAATARDGEVTYRWYKNGYSADVITSENTDEVIVKAEAGRQYYNCSVSDIYGNNTGISFEITTIVPEQLTLNQETTGTLERDNDNYSSKIYVFTPGESGIYTFTETGTHYSVYSYLNDNNGNVDCEFHETYDHVILSTELTAGTRYRLIISSYSGDDAEITIKVTKGAAEIEITDGYVLRSGQTARLPIDDAQTVTSSNTAVINANGTTVTAGQTGTARVTVTTSEGDKYLYDFMVKDGAVMNVPSALRTIEAEAFSEDEAIRFVNLSSNTKAIGAFAFNDSGLIQIVIPATDAKIAVSAFCDIRPTILCEENSLAAKMADKWGYRYLYID